VCGTRGAEPDRVQAVIDAEIARLGEEVGNDEVAKAKNCVETELWSGLESVDGKAEALGHFETSHGDFRELFALARRIEGATRDDVMRCAQQYLVPSRRTAVAAVPEATPGEPT
jgi:zinc protease